MTSQIFTRKAMNLIVLTLALVPALFSAGCGQGFAAADLGRFNSISNNGSGGNGSSSSPAEDAFKEYPADGAVDGGGYDDQKVIMIDKETKELVIGLPMMQFPSLDSIGSNLPIPEIPGAKIGMEDLLGGGGSGLTLRIPLDKILKGVEGAEPSRLPNGDPLPAIPDGELPSFAVSLSKRGSQKATIYLAPSVVGIFVNSSFDPKFAMTFPIRNQARTKTWGYFSTVPAKGTHQGGFFLSFALPDDLARIIDDMM